MDRNKLQECFCEKLNGELQAFKRKMEAQRPDTVFAEAYHIDCKVTFYELLLELCQTLSGRELEQFIQVPSLLERVYCCWMETEDQFADEMLQFLKRSRAEICGLTEEPIQERKEADAA